MKQWTRNPLFFSLLLLRRLLLLLLLVSMMMSLITRVRATASGLSPMSPRRGCVGVGMSGLRFDFASRWSIPLPLFPYLAGNYLATSS